ncbi:hypothetical protein HZC00_05510 [Candidatus Kaiserbacteria bacterium]|nr:hypothetical protein [Candidatus Kaiserbacteria bacterium]
MQTRHRRKLWRAIHGLILCLVIGFGLLAYQIYPQSKESFFEAGRMIVRVMRTKMPNAGNPVVQDLYVGLPSKIVGKTYFGAVKGCIDPEYEDLVFSPYRNQNNPDADEQSREISALFVDEGKCIKETLLRYRYKVLAFQEHFIVLGDEHALQYDKTTIGIVKISIDGYEWFGIPKTLYMTVFFPGVRT